RASRDPDHARIPRDPGSAPCFSVSLAKQDRRIGDHRRPVEREPPRLHEKERRRHSVDNYCGTVMTSGTQRLAPEPSMYLSWVFPPGFVCCATISLIPAPSGNGSPPSSSD